MGKENSDFVKRMLKAGRFNNQSEVIREALRRMEREESNYLNPRPLSDHDADRIYAPNPEHERLERACGRKSSESLRRLIKRKNLRLEDV